MRTLFLWVVSPTFRRYRKNYRRLRATGMTDTEAQQLAEQMALHGK